MQSDKTKRIAKNTLLLYIRMLFTMAVSLYTSRAVLNVLGVSDFGVYNVIGGVVGMFSILSGSLSSAISRFITFELGKGDMEKLKNIFSASIYIQLFIAFSVFLLAEIIGGWFLNAKLNIDQERMEAANWVFHCSILTFVANLINVPCNALIIAHERMKVFAYISVFEAVLKLFSVWLLFFVNWDKLILYAVFLLTVAILVCIVNVIYCKKSFEECVYRFRFEKEQLCRMTGFAGWNFIGVSSGVLKDQGVNVVINLFCGTAVNAARAISMQVNHAISAFVSSFMTALNPQITKSYAVGDYDYMIILIQQGARYSFYLLLCLSLPVIINADVVLLLWLKIVPEHTVLFVRLILVLAMCDTLSGTLITAMLATGKIRNYQILVGGLQLMNFPISYLLLQWNFPPETTVIVAIVISLLCLVLRLVMLRSMLRLSVRRYLKQVCGNVLLVSLLSVVFPLFIYGHMEQGIIRLVVVSISCLISTLLTVYLVGCSIQERVKINRVIKKF